MLLELGRNTALALFRLTQREMPAGRNKVVVTLGFLRYVGYRECTVVSEEEKFSMRARTINQSIYLQKQAASETTVHRAGRP